MSALWTAAEARAATGGKSRRDWQAQGVSIDSRSVAPGDLFIALVGPKFDGHDFVAAALAQGAAAAVVSRIPPHLAEDAPLLAVGDTQQALEALGRAARARTAATILAVTGSVGKSGTKEALRRAFEPQARTHASAGSLNNQWGVPLSLARLPREAAYGIFELGMNHPGEIDGLSRLVRPDIGIITTVEATHLGFFPSVEAIADAKAELFNGMAPQGAAILNQDNPHFARLAAAARARGLHRIIGFGADAGAAARLLQCHLEATASAVTATILGEIVDYSVAIPGRHWVMNSLAVLAAVKLAGGDLAAAAKAMAGIEPMDGRGRRHRIARRGGSITLIDESYNASPASMRAALAVLGASVPDEGGRRIAILGDMLELGEASAELHRALAEPLAAAKVDLVFTAGRDMRALHQALPPARRGAHRDSAAALAEIVSERLKPGDVVTVKGSNGSRMREVVTRLLAGARAVCAVKG